MKNRWVNQNGERWGWKWWRRESHFARELRLLKKWFKRSDPARDADLSAARLREQRAKIMEKLADL